MAKKIKDQVADQDEVVPGSQPSTGEEEYAPKFIPVDEGDERKGRKGSEEEEEEDRDDDERLSAEQRDAGDEGESDDDRKERRRVERRNKRDRQRAAITRDKTELNFLRTRLEQLELNQARLPAIERRQVNTEVGVIDSRIQYLEGKLVEVDEVLAKAIEANNGADVVRLTNIKNNINQGVSRLRGHRSQFVESANRQQQEEDGRQQVQQRGQSGTSQLSDTAIGKAQTFFNRVKSWYDPNGRDEDSAILLAIDSAVENEGFDPDSDEYWAELERRARRRLPDHFKARGRVNGDDDDDDDDVREGTDNGAGRRQPSRGGPRMPASGSGGGGGPQRFVLSADRKAALVEAGAWDDPKLRDKYIAKYKEWDEQNAQSTRR